MLLRTYQDLKFLGHPDYQDFVKDFQSSFPNKNVLKEEVIVFMTNACIDAVLCMVL